jgi:hypothetical protein
MLVCQLFASHLEAGLWTPHLSVPPEKVIYWSKETLKLFQAEIQAGWPLELAPVKVVSPEFSVVDMFWWIGDVLDSFTLSKILSPHFLTLQS